MRARSLKLGVKVLIQRRKIFWGNLRPGPGAVGNGGLRRAKLVVEDRLQAFLRLRLKLGMTH